MEEKILELNPTDSLSVLDSLSLMYFNKKDKIDLNASANVADDKV